MRARRLWMPKSNARQQEASSSFSLACVVMAVSSNARGKYSKTSLAASIAVHVTYGLMVFAPKAFQRMRKHVYAGRGCDC